MTEATFTVQRLPLRLWRVYWVNSRSRGCIGLDICTKAYRSPLGHWWGRYWFFLGFKRS